MERCTECGRLYESDRYLDDEDACPACGGQLVQLGISLGVSLRDVPIAPPTSGEDLTGRLLGIGA